MRITTQTFTQCKLYFKKNFYGVSRGAGCSI
jgi:hypothetical protein